MTSWRRAVEDLIARAIQRGEFDDLPGKGKPLPLDDHPFEDPDARTAHRLLREKGFTLPWLDERKAVEADLASARTALARVADWRRDDPDLADAEWERATQTFREQAAHLNRRIRDYNLKAPETSFHLRPLDAEAEIRGLEAGDAPA